MDMVYFLTLKGVNMLVNGTKIKCKAEAHYTMLMIKSLIKVNGLMINFMVMEFSTIKSLLIHQIPSTSSLSIYQTTFGPNMKETFMKIRKMEKELYSFLTANISEDLLKKDYLMVTEPLKLLMEKSSKEIGFLE